MPRPLIRVGKQCRLDGCAEWSVVGHNGYCSNAHRVFRREQNGAVAAAVAAASAVTPIEDVGTPHYFSITISRAGADINRGILQGLREWLADEATKGAFALERGDRLDLLHGQGVAEVRAAAGARPPF
jgi:hypothetical protein